MMGLSTTHAGATLQQPLRRPARSLCGRISCKAASSAGHHDAQATAATPLDRRGLLSAGLALAASLGLGLTGAAHAEPQALQVGWASAFGTTRWVAGRCHKAPPPAGQRVLHGALRTLRLCQPKPSHPPLQLETAALQLGDGSSLLGPLAGALVGGGAVAAALYPKVRPWIQSCMCCSSRHL